jgi:RNA polymerase sigma-70 factor (ECF subfamily)
MLNGPAMTAHAFGQAYQSGFDRTVRFLVSRGAARDGAMEAAQSAWARGWERLDQLRDERVLLTWINSIALNVYRGLLRRERLAVPLRESHSEFQIDMAPLYVESALKLCSRRERALLQLQLEGISAEEMAGQKGVSTTAMRIRLTRARQVLRKRLEKRPSADFRQPQCELVKTGQRFA